MITLQNALWKYRETWCTGNNFPHNPNSDERYWGWNEIPFSKATINDHRNWTCYVIVLPPGVQSLQEALKNGTAKENLIGQLNEYKSKYYLHDKSSIVLARQVKNPVVEKKLQGLVWMREFFEEKVSIGDGWHIEDGMIRL